MQLAKQVVLSLEFSTHHRKQLALKKRVKDLEHDKESLRCLLYTSDAADE